MNEPQATRACLRECFVYGTTIKSGCSRSKRPVYGDCILTITKYINGIAFDEITDKNAKSEFMRMLAQANNNDVSILIRDNFKYNNIPVLRQAKFISRTTNRLTMVLTLQNKCCY